MLQGTFLHINTERLFTTLLSPYFRNLTASFFILPLLAAEFDMFVQYFLLVIQLAYTFQSVLTFQVPRSGPDSYFLEGTGEDQMAN